MTSETRRRRDRALARSRAVGGLVVAGVTLVVTLLFGLYQVWVLRRSFELSLEWNAVVDWLVAAAVGLTPVVGSIGAGIMAVRELGWSPLLATVVFAIPIVCFVISQWNTRRMARWSQERDRGDERGEIGVFEDVGDYGEGSFSGSGRGGRRDDDRDGDPRDNADGAAMAAAGAAAVAAHHGGTVVDPPSEQGSAAAADDVGDTKSGGGWFSSWGSGDSDGGSDSGDSGGGDDGGGGDD